MQSANIGTQIEIVCNYEADKWFLRNESKLLNSHKYVDVTFLLEQLKNFHIETVLEIGCSSGIKLKMVADYFDAFGTGADPSKLAIAKAQENNYANVRFYVATADNLPLESFTQDLVIIGFCLYLIDDNNIYKSLQETIRVLKPGGFLVVTDFDVKEKQVSTYKHDPRLKTYKRNLDDLFKEFSNMKLISKISYSENSIHFSKDMSQRISTLIFFNEMF